MVNSWFLGKSYLKTNTGFSNLVKMENAGQIQEWYIHGCTPAHQQRLLNRTKEILPGKEEDKTKTLASLYYKVIISLK